MTNMSNVRKPKINTRVYYCIEYQFNTSDNWYLYTADNSLKFIESQVKQLIKNNTEGRYFGSVSIVNHRIIRKIITEISEVLP